MAAVVWLSFMEDRKEVKYLSYHGYFFFQSAEKFVSFFYDFFYYIFFLFWFSAIDRKIKNIRIDRHSPKVMHRDNNHVSWISSTPLRS